MMTSGSSSKWTLQWRLIKNKNKNDFDAFIHFLSPKMMGKTCNIITTKCNINCGYVYLITFCKLLISRRWLDINIVDWCWNVTGAGRCSLLATQCQLTITKMSKSWRIFHSINVSDGSLQYNGNMPGPVLPWSTLQSGVVGCGDHEVQMESQAEVHLLINKSTYKCFELTARLKIYRYT